MGSATLKVVGGVLVFVGVLLATNPELISTKAVPADPFEAIERRITWGKLIGLGLVPFFHHQLRPWVPTLAATLSALIVGYLIARLIGILMDGSVAKQWLYVGVELAILAPLVWWYAKVRT